MNMTRELNLTKRSIGVNFNEEGVADVCVWAPEKDNVTLIKQTGERITLAKDEMGYWHNHAASIKPGDLYKFQMDGERIYPDPASLSQPDGVHGYSQALDLSYNWTDKEWSNLPLKDYVIYELHVGTFSKAGTFEAIIDKLDYLKELGIAAVEIMPVAQFPGSRNWGYDGVFPFATQDSYGGATALQKLVNGCHAKGLAVILDVVYNHVGPEGNYLSQFAPYFTDKYGTPWGSAINFDDAYCDGVRRYFIENVLMWFRDFHIDALRMDAVHAIKDFSCTHILREIREEVNKLMAITQKVHYLIAECDLNDTRFINPTEEQGYGMNTQWIDEFHHALRVTAGQEQNGYYADFNGIRHLAKAYKDAYVYDGQYSPHRKKKFGVKADNAGQQFIIFSQNHDQVGNRMLGERTSTLLSFEKQKLLAGAVMVAPYLPMLFMGEEYSEPAPFLYFVSHTDPALVEAVRKGRKSEFSAFHAQGEAPDPQSEETFLQSKLQWKLLKKEPHQTMLRYYKALITLRKTNPVLSSLNRKNLDVRIEEQQQVLMLHRWMDDQHLLCMMNFSEVPQTILVPPMEQSWKLLFDSGDPSWNGIKAAAIDIGDNSELLLQPETIVIYANH